MTYPIIEVPEGASSQLEQLGTKSKFWYRDEHDKRGMFKRGRPGTGENWAEKVCCEICRLLGLPHAICFLMHLSAIRTGIIRIGD